MRPSAADDPRPRMLIVGCSTRAAAWSAMRAGYRPVCADQFGDLDLHAVADVIPVTHYPHSLPDDVNCVKTDQWMYTGAMENHPEVLRRLAEMPQLGELSGIAAAALPKLRDPWFVQRLANDAGLPSIPCRDTPPTNDEPSRWLLKPRRSGGGIGARIAVSDPISEQIADVYWQRFIAGPVGSAVFQMIHQRVELVGFTSLQCGLIESGCLEPFGYGGNIGPWELSDYDEQRLIAAAWKLSQMVRLGGMFGIDFVLTAAGPCLLEINPRYTASMELFEFLRRVPLLSMNPMPNSTKPACRAQCGKRILYARSRVVAPDLSRLIPRASPWSLPLVADLPQPGTIIEPGKPLCTIYARGHSWQEVERKLQRRMQRVRSTWGCLEG